MSRKQQNNGPAFQEFDRRVRKLTSIGWDRQRAVASVAAKDPELHRQMVIEQNTGSTDPRVLQAVASGSESIAPPVQRPGVVVKQATTKPVAGTTTPKPTLQASAVPVAPVAPVAPAVVAPIVVVATPTTVDANPQRCRFNYDPSFSPFNVIPW